MAWFTYRIHSIVSRGLWSFFHFMRRVFK